MVTVKDIVKKLRDEIRAENYIASRLDGTAANYIESEIEKLKEVQNGVAENTTGHS
jgi:hypothetical protein